MRQGIRQPHTGSAPPQQATSAPPPLGPTILTQRVTAQGPEMQVAIARVYLPIWSTPARRRRTPVQGRRTRSLRRPRSRRGRYLRARLPHTTPDDIAWDATLRAAAPHQRHRKRVPPLRWALHPQDLREKERVATGAHLVLFVVDASWSMAVSKRMEATKGAVLTLLEEAYQRRDRVGMIVFRRNSAQLVLPPTPSVRRARQALSRVPIGGKTPLAAGLALAYQVIERERRKDPHLRPLVVVLTDGAGNVPLQEGKDPMEEAYAWARRLARARVEALVINMEQPEYGKGLAYKLARVLRAPCLTPLEWTPQYLAAQVRRRLRGQG